MKRTFIAVPLEASPALKRLLAFLQEKLKREGIKWVETNNLHITLKFLGDTPENLIGRISEKLEELSSGFIKQDGQMKGLDTFTRRGNPSVLYTCLTGLPVLEMMASAIDREMIPFGFSSGEASFNAHLTLARIKYLNSRSRFLELIGSLREKEIQEVTIDKIVLFESILRPQGPLYKPLKTILLG